MGCHQQSMYLGFYLVPVTLVSERCWFYHAEARNRAKTHQLISNNLFYLQFVLGCVLSPLMHCNKATNNELY